MHRPKPLGGAEVRHLVEAVVAFTLLMAAVAEVVGRLAGESDPLRGALVLAVLESGTVV